MNPRMSSNLLRLYVCLFLVAAGLVGFVEVTVRSESESHDQLQRGLGESYRSAEKGLESLGLKTLQRSNSAALLRDMEQFLQSPTAKIGPRVLADTADGNSTPVIILLAVQADVSAANEMKDQDARGWYVYNTLTQHAARTQVALQDFLTSQGVTYQSFWVANSIQVNADRTLVEALAARKDVGKIESNMAQRWIEEPQLAKLSNAPQSPNAIEAGVNNVRAPQVWAFGFTGQGIVIGNQDTGILWDHNALKPKYRGWDGVSANHNYNWHDAIHSGGGSCGPNSAIPCDDNGHGTHTTGTTVGEDAGSVNQVGVAPGAKWIGCRNMDQGNGTPATYMECFQFFIAPTNLANGSANPALRPHVMNNSWGCPPSEGCAANTLLATVQATESAGIFVVVSAGNGGSGCSSVDDPPAIYAESFSVGAINASGLTSPYPLVGFSSRGPVTVDGSNRLKPNISAPGSGVRSSTRTSISSYGNSSGTSMAGPHVAGVVALLWSARPVLSRNIAQTKALLQNTANPDVTVSPAQTCGGTLASTPGLSQIPNNSFGYGRVDALAAYNAAPTAAPATISGQVTTSDGQPLAGVVVQMSGGESRKTITDGNGTYRFENVDTANFYTVTPARVNYHFDPDNRSFTLSGDMTTAVFTATPDAVQTGNPLDTPEYFVRQHYLDFLGREPDESGFNFWSDQIIECGADASCIDRRRVNVSAAYFLSIEFQQTGGLVDGLYRASYARRPLYAEFMPDTGVVAQGVIVGRGNWAQQLEENKQAFVDDWVQRAAFRAAYDGLTNDAFVDTLITHTEGGFNGDRNALVNGLNGGTMTRTAVLRQVVENDGFVRAKSNQMFVMMEYFGYLRRDPDESGYRFWLNKLNQFGGNFEQAEMVKAFIVSGEYRGRFPQ